MLPFFRNACAQRPRGFTLVEISIVLVVVGLILGGVMVGQSMIRSSQVGKLNAEVEAYRAAVASFQDKYATLPGDLTNASRYWTGASSGDGDGRLDNFAENFNFWRHLALSGQIKGSFTGVTGPGSAYDAVIHANVPESALGDAGYMPLNSYNTGVNYFYADGDIGLLLGRDVGGSYTFAPALTVGEAYAMDQKFDDGLAVSGIIKAANQAFAPNCTTTNLPATAVYSTAYTDIACTLFFLL
jgi:prepilin-type N-terminal cleavage/methylation domain-containing protein